MPSEEVALWRALKQDGLARARERIFSIYQPLARRIAARHFLDRKRGDIEFPDLSQLACAGLLEAIDSYDIDRGVPFRYFAGRRISGSVLNGLAKMSEVREQISFRNRVRRDRLRSLAEDDADRLPINDTLQALVDLATGLAVGFMLEDTAGLYMSEGQADTRANAYETVAWKDMVRRTTGEIVNLPEREQALIRHHYLEGMTFEQIGALLGLSKGRISQLHRAAIGLLKKRLLNSGGFKLEQ